MKISSSLTSNVFIASNVDGGVTQATWTPSITTKSFILPLSCPSKVPAILSGDIVWFACKNQFLPCNPIFHGFYWSLLSLGSRQQVQPAVSQITMHTVNLWNNTNLSTYSLFMTFAQAQLPFMISLPNDILGKRTLILKCLLELPKILSGQVSWWILNTEVSVVSKSIDWLIEFIWYSDIHCTWDEYWYIRLSIAHTL